MRVALSCAIVLMLLACGAPHGNASPGRTSVEPGVGSDTVQAYRSAIADYIKAMDTSDAPIPDTLYIGRHADFPDIELPDIIGKTVVRIITPAEGEPLQGRAHFAYLNIFGWFSPPEVEFFVVRFHNGMRHDPNGAEDRHLYYRIDSVRHFTLESVKK